MEDYISALSTRDYCRRLSARSAKYGTVVIPSEILTTFWQNVRTLRLHWDSTLSVLMLTPADIDEVKHDK